jgi:hypothetical protein
MGASLGMNGKLYRLTTGVRASWGTADANGFNVGTAPANLSEVGNVVDVDFNFDSKEADATTRGNNGWEAVLYTLKSGEVTFEMNHDPTNTDFVAFWKAFILNGSIACAILDADKAVTGTTGVWADFAVKMSKSEHLDEVQKWKVTLKPSGLSTVAPQIVKVS